MEILQSSISITTKLLDLGLVINNEYLIKYSDLMENNLQTKAEKFKTQKHHIIPKYYYKDKKISIDNSVNNLINLSYKDHILAHYYLALCSIERFKYANEMAIKFMVDTDICDTSFLYNLDHFQELYTDSKIKFSKMASCFNTGKIRSQSVKEKCRQRKLGIKLSDETKLKMSDTQTQRWKYMSLENKMNFNNKLKGLNKGKIHSLEQNLQHSKMMQGRIETTSHKQKIKTTMETYWAAHQNQIYIFKDNIMKRISESDLDKYTKEGWNRGRKKRNCKSSVSL